MGNGTDENTGYTNQDHGVLLHAIKLGKSSIMEFQGLLILTTKYHGKVVVMTIGDLYILE